MYSPKVIKHFTNPKYMGTIKKPDGIGRAGNPVCGDTMELFVKIKTGKKGAKDVISNLKFQTLGCAAAISTSDVACEILKGKTIDEALKIKAQDIVKELDGLPVPKIHCSLLAIEALQSAIKDYLDKKNAKAKK